MLSLNHSLTHHGPVGPIIVVSFMCGRATTLVKRVFSQCFFRSVLFSTHSFLACFILVGYLYSSILVVVNSNRIAMYTV